MKREKGITLVALVVTIIVLIILAGISINLILGDNGIITTAQKAKENMELAKVEEERELNELYTQLETGESSSGNLPYESIIKLTEFKTAIASAIEEAGGIKPDTSAEISVFANNIKGIVKEVTKNATATASDIAKGKTAWVNGTKVTGTMENATSTIKNYGNVSSGNISADFPDYKNMTNSNFFLVCTSASASPGRIGGNPYGIDSSSISPKINYNSTDGSFTVSNTSINKSGSSVEIYTASLSISYNVICVY